MQEFFSTNFYWQVLAPKFASPQVCSSALQQRPFVSRRKLSPHSNFDAQAGRDHLTCAPARRETHHISSRSSWRPSQSDVVPWSRWKVQKPADCHLACGASLRGTFPGFVDTSPEESQPQASSSADTSVGTCGCVHSRLT